MQLHDSQVLISASDVVDACLCDYLPVLERARLNGEGILKLGSSPDQALLSRHAALHEQMCLQALSREGRRVVTIPDSTVTRSTVATERAMAAGAEVIYQGTLLDRPWHGRPDFLLRVPGRSRFGDFGYEVLDAKLARQARSQALIQATVYSLLLAKSQGAAPERLHLWLGSGQRPSYRTADYSAYAVLAQRRLLDPSPSRPGGAPDPVAHCPRCRFLPYCDGLRRAEDHLFSLPGIQRRQISRLRQQGIATVGALGDPNRLTGNVVRPAVARLSQLAALRLKARSTGQPCYELRTLQPGHGLARLPEPTVGDLYFDLEGDPFADNGSLEYLWGWLSSEGQESTYACQWATGSTEERVAFEAFVDLVTKRRERWPGMHVFHYAAYETTALKRLMGRYGTRETAVDDLLRGQVFVDLYRVTYEALNVSTESYSLKDLESFYLPGHRHADVKTATASVVAYDIWKATGDNQMLADIRAYNEEDCRSTASLRNWLEALRREAGVTDRPTATSTTVSSRVQARDASLTQQAGLLAGGPPSERPGRELLAGLMHWYRREQRPQWWSYFSRLEASPEELLDDPDCLAGLTLLAHGGGYWTFGFDPVQEYTLRRGDQPCDPRTGQRTGQIVDLDPHRGTVRLRSQSDLSNLQALVPGTPLDVTQQEQALGRLCDVVAAHGLGSKGPYRHLRDLLAGTMPRFQGVPQGTPLQGPGDDPEEAAKRLVLVLDHSTLAIQGPPGTGKTTLAGTLVASLLLAGKRVGITAQSHKVIGNLLHAIDRALPEGRHTIRGVQRAPAGEGVQLSWVTPARDNRSVLTSLSGGALLVAGTAWLFSRSEMDSLLDVLVVDEAGQYALADAISSGTAARNLVLVGDPQQLRQVVQGTHPPGVAVSALEHVLAGRPTMPPELGIFLPVTRRLHPDIAAFISETSYEGRLEAASGCALRGLSAPEPSMEAHLCYVPVRHEGNRRSSVEEVEAVVRIVGNLLTCTFHDEMGQTRPLGWEDILVVAPFNAHVQRLTAALGANARVGTVDRFQGQEAPVVIYTTATSDPEHIPHGLEFLFSLNRLNVAISRAQVLAVMVGSPELLRTWSADPEKLRLVSALCRFATEAATR